jgi:Gpi18-like mannosyltransferase
VTDQRAEGGWGWIRSPLLAFFVTRAGIAAIAYFGAIYLPDSTPPPYHLRSPDNVLIDVFGSRWDTGFYVGIAEEGYTFVPGQLSPVAFFPLLPLTMRALHATGIDTLVAGILISNLALLGATLFFYRLTAVKGAAIADRAVWYLLLFPTSFFGSAIYGESLFLLGAVGALHVARCGWWESAALLGLLTGLTRFVGIIVGPMLLVEWIVQRRAGRRPPAIGIVAAAAPAIGVGLYSLYLYAVFGDPLLFVRAAAAWGRGPASPAAGIEDIVREFPLLATGL